MDNQTTARLRRSTIERIVKHGKYRDTIDSILSRLLDRVKWN